MASYEPLNESNEWNELSTAQRLARYALCYLLWAGFTALGVLTAFLIRESYLGFLPVWGPWRMTGIDRFSVVFIVVFLLSYVLYTEHYLRRGVVTGRLGAHAWRLLLWHIPVTGGLYLASIAIPRLVAGVALRYPFV